MKKIIVITEYIDKKEYEIIKINLFKRGITISDIAKNINVSQQYVSNIICGKRPLTPQLKNYLEELGLIKFEE